MSGSFHGLNSYIAKFDHVAIFQRRMIELRASSFAQTNSSSRLITQLDMTRQKVGVEVSQKDILDRVSASLRIGQILLNVTLWINHGSRFCLLIGNHV